MTELKPCPECKKPDALPQWHSKAVSIECRNCGHETPMYYREVEAVEVWNQRTPSPMDQLIAETGDMGGFDESWEGPLTAEEQSMIDAAWEKHKAAGPSPTDHADLLDEIAEAISDTLDMDWQPSWAAPNIMALINRERAAAHAAGRAEERASGFQSEVGGWMLECFGPEIAADRLERADRFIEEALELCQTWPAFTADRAHALVDYVFNRPVGEPAQEVGGVMVTLAALCNTAGISIHDAAETELARVWTKVEDIRAKQASKPTGSALPVAIERGQHTGADDE